MLKKNPVQFALKLTTLILAVNMACSYAVMAQSNQSSINITRTGTMSFVTVPTTLDFGSASIPSEKTPIFTDPVLGGSGNLPVERLLTVEDAREEGGFIVTLSANADFTNETSDTIPISATAPNDNLRIVTTPLVEGPVGTTTNGVVYLDVFSGPETVTANINTGASGTNDFGTTSTFTSVSNNILDTTTPVEVLNGTLAATDGRLGHMAVGVAGMLYIPAYQATGSYSTTLTWTLTDSTT